MNYIVTKSIAHQGNKAIAECESFDEAVEASRDAGATGTPQQMFRGEWYFSGGSDAVGYWITEA